MISRHDSTGDSKASGTQCSRLIQRKKISLLEVVDVLQPVVLDECFVRWMRAIVSVGVLTVELHGDAVSMAALRAHLAADREVLHTFNLGQIIRRLQEIGFDLVIQIRFQTEGYRMFDQGLSFFTLRDGIGQ